MLASCAREGNEPAAGGSREAPASGSGAASAPAAQAPGPAGGAPAGSTPAASATHGMIEMSFDVDPALLGFTFEDTLLGIRYAPPRGWPALSAEQFGSVRAALDQVEGREARYSAEPTRIFYEPKGQLFLILARLPNWPLALDPIEGLREYRMRLEGALGDIAIQDAIYRRGSIGIYQLQLSNEIMMNIRLFLIQDGRSPVKVDYLVPRPAFPVVAKAIEASIGSIQPL